MFKIIKGTTNFICGINDIKDVDKFVVGSLEPMVGICMVGRSNVGKSSLINTMFGNKTARTSNTPGRTREINMFDFQIQEEETKEMHKFFLFDLPGYGHAEVSQQMKQHWQDLMGYFFTNIPRTLILINIQDARNPNQKSDIQFQDFIKEFSQATVLVFNKIDKLKKQKERSALNKLKPKIMEQNKWVHSIHYVSAEKKTGVAPLEETIIGKLVEFAGLY